MKDPKVSEQIKELANLVSNLNQLTEELSAEGVNFTLGVDTISKKYIIKYLTQSVRYDEELEQNNETN